MTVLTHAPRVLSWAMASAGAMQSAALRRLAAAMRQDEEQVLQAQQAAREEERERTSAARSKVGRVLSVNYATYTQGCLY